jgi:hypothetical protein
MNLLNCLGVGTVAATKDTNTDQIMVYLPSLFPQADGRVSASVKQVDRSSVNAAGEEIKSTLMHSNAVPAVWKNMGNTNRLTSPDVREGSQVAIYQVSGQNKYYWTTDGVNASTFRLESVMWGWSGSPDVSENADFDVDKFYMAKVDTRTGLMAVRTAMANGEKSMWDIQINGMEGIIQIGGNEGSFMVMNDMERAFTYTNADKSFLRIEKKKMTVYMPEQLNLFTDVDINIKTKTINIQAEEMNIDVGLTRWKGRIEHTGDTEQVGDYTQEGNYNLSGDIDQEGDMTQDGNIDSSGTIHADVDVTSLTSLNYHVQTGVRGGSDTSGPPVPTGG